MTRSRIIFIVVALAVVLGGGAVWWRAQVQRADWAAVRPGMPDLTNATPALRTKIAEIDARVAKYPPDIAALGELARLYHANGFQAEAERTYRGLVRYDPQNAHWPHLLAILLAGYGRLDEAIPLLQSAAQLAPDYVPSKLRLGDALLKAGRTDEAEVAYQAVLKLQPNDGYALLGLARIDLARERFTAAREKLTRASAANPTFYGVLASVFERLGDDDAAASARARASQAGRFREAPDPWVDSLVDECYDVYRLQVAAATAKQTGDADAAIPVLERALKLAPDDARTLRQFGTIFLQKRDFTRAAELLERAVSLAPQDSSAWVQLATLRSATGDVAGAQRTLETALTRCSDAGPLQAELGALLIKTRQLPEGIAHLQEAVRLSPEKPEIARDLVTTLFEAGRAEEAAVTLKDALARYPEFAPLLVQGARYAVARNDAADAESLLRRAEKAGASPGELAKVAGDYRRQFGHNPP